MKKLFTFTFLLLYTLSITTFAANTWDGASVSEEFSGGDGSERNPWQIHSPQDLALLSRQVNEGEAFTGQYFILMNDIDLGGKEWSPIGTSDDISFRGTFDGNSHLISNLYVNRPTTSGVGLFGYVYNATIRDLGITGNSSVTGKERVGGLVGRCYINAEGHTISGCFSDADVTASNNSAGGLIGIFRSTKAFSVEDCYTAGDVTGYNYTGGILGQLDQNTDFSISNCYSAGMISSVTESPRTGGILTKVSSIRAIVSNCYYINGDESNANSALKKTAEEMRSEEFVELLNNHRESLLWKADFENPVLNGGLPVHTWREPLSIELNMNEIVIATLVNKPKSMELICTLGFVCSLDNMVCELSGSSPFSVAGKTELGDNRVQITVVLDSRITGEFSDILRVRFSSQGAELKIPLRGSVFENAAILLSTDKLEFDVCEGEGMSLPFVLSGANLENDVLLSVGGDAAYFTLDKYRIAADEVNAGIPITVTFDGKANAEATVEITSLSGTGDEITASLRLTGKIAPAPVFTEATIASGGYDYVAVRVASDSVTTVYYVLKTEPDEKMTADLIRKSPDKKCKYLESPFVAEGILLENLDASIKYYLYLALAKGDKMECLSFVPGPELFVDMEHRDDCRVWAAKDGICVVSECSGPIGISIYDLRGVLLKTVVSMQNETKVDMEGKGVYMVVITSVDGRYVKKLVLD